MRVDGVDLILFGAAFLVMGLLVEASGERAVLAALPSVLVGFGVVGGRRLWLRRRARTVS